MWVKRLVSIHLSLVLGLSSLAPFHANAKASTCENGECVPVLIERLENLGQVYRRECIPPGKIPINLEAYHLEHGLSEACWKYITEINHLETELLKHENRLETKVGCTTGDCKISSSDGNLQAQLGQLNIVEEEISCTETKKMAIQRQCPEDTNCVLASSALSIASLPMGTMGGYLAEKFLPEKNKLKNCHLGDDSCVTQLGTAFFKSAMTFLDGAWDLLKLAGNAAGKKMSEFWDWVSGAEDHTSTSQLALAKASEDPSVFQALLDDFPGTMKKIWETFVVSLKEWLKTSIFCEKWEGVPHFGKCLKPTENYDCLPCKTLLTGLCGISGTIIAEIVPSFLAGGLVTAVKHGARGAANIARMFKVSKAGIKAVKASSVARPVTRVSRIVIGAKSALSISLSTIKTYMLSPVRKTLKASFTALSKLAKKGSVYVAESATGRVITFSGKAVKNSLAVVLYPVDNPLTTMAFKAGAKTVDKAFKLGAPKLAYKTTVTAAIIDSNAKLEPLLARIQKTKFSGKMNQKYLLKLEEELLSSVGPIRKKLLRDAFKKGTTEIPDVIKHLYPELQYGELAKKVSKAKLIQAEKELYAEIIRLPKGPLKTASLVKYKTHVATGASRARILATSNNIQKSPIVIPSVHTGLGKVLSPTLRGSKEDDNKEVNR